jgi:hypothetical protein
VVRRPDPPVERSTGRPPIVRRPQEAVRNPVRARRRPLPPAVILIASAIATTLLALLPASPIRVRNFDGCACPISQLPQRFPRGRSLLSKPRLLDPVLTAGYQHDTPSRLHQSRDSFSGAGSGPLESRRMARAGIVLPPTLEKKRQARTRKDPRWRASPQAMKRSRNIYSIPIERRARSVRQIRASGDAYVAQQPTAP